MPRNYTLSTIKTLFGEASTCAYPGCEEPLIFRDREKSTVVAEIAHIRSESPDGPRHDPNCNEDVNGPSNLLLLCGKHHRPVDRHEELYEIEELEAWKTAQQESAGRGTPLTDSDARAYARLTSDEREALLTIARLSQRVIGTCRTAQGNMEAVREESEQARLRAMRQFGPMYEIHEDGSRTLNASLQLSHVEQQEWFVKELAARDRELPGARKALQSLAEEVAVLRMIAVSLAEPASAVSAAAEQLLPAIGDAEALDTAIVRFETAKSRLWQIANGLEDGQS